MKLSIPHYSKTSWSFYQYISFLAREAQFFKPSDSEPPTAEIQQSYYFMENKSQHLTTS